MTTVLEGKVCIDETFYNTDYESHTITDLGKFEGEARYVPHFWSISLDGGIDDELYYDGTQPTVYMMLVEDSDRTLFPELAGYHGLALHESEQGFVTGELLTKAEYDRALRDYETWSESHFQD